MSNVIEIIQTIESSRVLASLVKQQQEIRKLKRELDGLKTSGYQAGSAITSSAASAGRQMMQAVAQLTGIGSGIAALMAIANQLRAEVQNLRSTQAEAGNSQIALGRVYANIAANIPQSGNAQQDALKVRSMVEGLARRTGQTRLRAGTALNAGLAGAGPETDAQVAAVEAATEAALNTFGSAGDEEVKLMTGAGVDLTKAYNFETPQQSLGYLQRVQQVARIEDPKPLAEHAAPALAKSAAFGSSPEDAGSLFGLLTSRLVDREGAITATVIGRLEDQLKERFPHLPDTTSRIKEMQKHPEKMPEFFGGGTFGEEKFGKAAVGRSNAKPVLEQLFTAGSDIDKEWEQRRRQMGSRKDWEGVDAQKRATLAAIPELNQEQLKRELASGAEGVQIANISGGTAGIGREGLQEFLKASGLSDIQQKAAMLEFEWNTSLGGKMPVEEVSRQLRKQAFNKRNPATGGDYLTRAMHFVEGEKYEPQRDPSKATDEDRIAAGVLEATAEALDRTAVRSSASQKAAIADDVKRSSSASLPISSLNALADLRHIRTELKADGDVTDAERTEARGKITAARAIVTRDASRMSPEDAALLRAQLAETCKELGKLAGEAHIAQAASAIQERGLPRKWTEDEQTENLDSALKAKQDLIKLHGEIKSDDNFTPEEREAAYKRIGQANFAGTNATQQGAVSGMSAPLMGALNEQIQELINVNMQLIKSLNHNSVKTDENTNTPVEIKGNRPTGGLVPTKSASTPHGNKKTGART